MRAEERDDDTLPGIPTGVDDASEAEGSDLDDADSAELIADDVLLRETPAKPGSLPGADGAPHDTAHVELPDTQLELENVDMRRGELEEPDGGWLEGTEPSFELPPGLEENDLDDTDGDVRVERNDDAGADGLPDAALDDREVVDRLDSRVPGSKTTEEEIGFAEAQIDPPEVRAEGVRVQVRLDRDAVTPEWPRIELLPPAATTSAFTSLTTPIVPAFCAPIVLCETESSRLAIALVQSSTGRLTVLESLDELADELIDDTSDRAGSDDSEDSNDQASSDTEAVVRHALRGPRAGLLRAVLALVSDREVVVHVMLTTNENAALIIRVSREEGPVR